MFDLDRFQEIWQTITRNKTRSFLTAFGVFWGMFMFITMLGIGQGFENGMKKQVGNIATNSMFVMSRQTTVEYKGFNAGRYWQMSGDDITLLTEQVPEIKHISALVFSNGGKATYGEKSSDVSMRGNDEVYNEIEKQEILYGRIISRLDMLEKRKVCVLGNKVYDQLFMKDEDPVGKMVKVGAVYYTVVGVVRPAGNISFGGDGGSTVFVPTSTLQQLSGLGNEIHLIAISVDDHIKITEIEERVKNILKTKHLISPLDQNAVMTFNLQDMFLMFFMLFLGISILIWIVGMGTLFAGAVGISNIMLVTVKERTNEIGIKRALGARPNVITIQILWESVILTFIAGFLGMFFGILVLVGLEQFVQEGSMFSNPTISFNMAIAGTLIIIISGLLAGIIPARNALRIKAIDALRDE